MIMMIMMMMMMMMMKMVTGGDGGNREFKQPLHTAVTTIMSVKTKCVAIILTG